MSARIPPSAFALICVTVTPFFVLLVVGDRLFTGKGYLYHGFLFPSLSVLLCAVVARSWAYTLGCAAAMLSVFLYFIRPNLGEYAGNPWAGLLVLIAATAGTVGAMSTSLIPAIRNEQLRKFGFCGTFLFGYVSYCISSAVATLLVIAYEGGP